MKKNKIIISLILLCLSSSIFAASSSFIRVTNTSNGKDLYAYNDSINNFKYTIEGSVSEDCVAVRCLWSKVSLKTIEEYLVLGKNNPGENSTIDDFVLKQYKPGSGVFAYNVSGKFENLVYGSNYYKFVASFKDGSIKITDLEIYVYNGGGAEKAKPVIYLYPTTTQTINVKVTPAGGVTQSIPEYKNGWTVTATSEGVITDKATKKEYPYLFWESADDGKEIDMSEGFVVETKKLESFFTEKLTLLGLNSKEIADFNEYWVPELQGKKYIFITFYSKERIDQEAPLTIEPKYDSIIRVYFDHKKLDKKIKVKEQKLSSTPRNGFTVVEWGGKRYK